MATKKLTKAELHLLAFPPTQTTWVCGAGRPTSDNPKASCGMYNPGTQERCWMCAAPPKKKKILLWPTYLKAAKKAGIPEESLGKRFSPEVVDVPVVRKRRVRRKAAT